MYHKIFKDRTDAAIKLADKIKNYLASVGLDIDTDSKESNSLIVLAIPRGGVITGDVVASELKCPMDIIVSRKIGAEYNPELAIGALMPDGTYFINKDISNTLDTSYTYINKQVEIQKKN